MKRHIIFCIAALALASCAGNGSRPFEDYSDIYTPEYATGFRILGAKGSRSTVIVTGTPWQGSAEEETMLFISRDGEKAPEGFTGEVVNGDAERIVCMSSTYVAMLDFLGELRRVCAVSGKQFISNEAVRNDPGMPDVGYDSGTDYETLLASGPDIVLLYGVNGKSQAEAKLRELGIPFAYIGEYLEESPLGKAEWLVVIAEIAGVRGKGEKMFAGIPERYQELRHLAAEAGERPKVMVNAPYGDSWFMSPADSYIGQLIRDAGGDYVYTGLSDNKTRTVETEQAYALMCGSDIWLNAGNATTLGELVSYLPGFADTPPVVNGKVFNNNLRLTPGGGNDFWESGVVHPDLILADLIRIFHPGLLPEGGFEYYRKLEQD